MQGAANVLHDDYSLGERAPKTPEQWTEWTPQRGHGSPALEGEWSCQNLPNDDIWCQMSLIGKEWDICRDANRSPYRGFYCKRPLHTHMSLKAHVQASGAVILHPDKKQALKYLANPAYSGCQYEKPLKLQSWRMHSFRGWNQPRERPGMYDVSYVSQFGETRGFRKRPTCHGPPCGTA